MKKIIAILACMALLVTGVTVFAGCGKEKGTGKDPADSGLTGGDVLGGWTKAESPEITDAFRTVFAKATSALTGMEYVPVAYLASQVVSGTNHRVLCRAAATVPDAEATYAVVYVYEDPNGGAEITGVAESDIKANLSEDDGGWSEPASPAVPQEAQQALAKACETLAGMEYTPVALLASQTVSGMSYRLLCEARATVPGAATEYEILTVYADPRGKAEITETAALNAELQAQIANPQEQYGSSMESLADAEKAVGFTLSLPGSVTPENIIVINGAVLEVNFDGGYIRKAKGNEDISGDYNSYETTQTKAADGKEVTLKGNGGKIMLAIWTAGDYTYCAGVADGETEAGMLALVNEIK